MLFFHFVIKIFVALVLVRVIHIKTKFSFLSQEILRRSVQCNENEKKKTRTLVPYEISTLYPDDVANLNKCRACIVIMRVKTSWVKRRPTVHACLQQLLLSQRVSIVLRRVQSTASLHRADTLRSEQFCVASERTFRTRLNAARSVASALGRMCGINRHGHCERNVNDDDGAVSAAGDGRRARSIAQKIIICS